jgi:hypothetical protein
MPSATSNVLTRLVFFTALLNWVGFYSNKVKSNFQIMPRRFILENGEVFRINHFYSEFQVLSGVAWVTIEGKDLILCSGEKLKFESKKAVALISALGKQQLIVEVL